MMLLANLRFALRRYRSRPLYAVTAVLTLGLGIASTTATYSVVDGVLLRPLPWTDADRLATIWVARPSWRTSPGLASDWDRGMVSWPIYLELQARSRAFDSVATWVSRRFTLNGERNESVHGLQVSASFLPMLGVKPHSGRFFKVEEDIAPTDAVIVSYETWQRRFGGVAAILGRRVSLDERLWTVVGVLPAGFNFTQRDPPEFVTAFGNVAVSDRNQGNHFMYGIGRLAPGITLEAALHDVDPLIRATSTNEPKEARLRPLVDEQLGQSRRPLLLLLWASALLLLIACANVAGLFLGEAASRRQEVAVRAALGGTRLQLIRQLLVESLLIGAAASVVGLVLALWLVPGFVALAPTQLPRLTSVGIDGRVLVFCIATAVVASIVFGIVPAVAMAGTHPTSTLRAVGRGIVHRTRGQRAVVATQVALAAVLLTGAVLFGETLARLTSQSPGFDADGLVVAAIRTPPNPNERRENRSARDEEFVAGLAALPGVVDAAVASAAPFSGSYGTNSIQLGDNKRSDNDPSANRHIVSDGYFRTLSIPILKGRGFNSSDRPGAHVALVTAEFERRLMGGEAIGKHFTLNGDRHDIIGVIGATKQRKYADEAATAFYILNRQARGWSTPHVIARVRVPPESMMGAIRQTIENVEPHASVVLIDTMDHLMRRSVADEAYRAWMSIAFSVLALGLLAIALYGLLARSVADRRSELGVRIALGADARAIVRLVLGQGLRLVFVGLGVGVAVATMIAQALRAWLYGVTASSTHVFVVVAAVILGVSIVAMIWPALAAARVDPTIAIRE